MEEEKEEVRRMDEEDKQRIVQEQKTQEIQKKLRLRNLAIQKNLPRPFVIPLQVKNKLTKYYIYFSYIWNYRSF